MKKSDFKMIAIVGPTASGKSELAVRISKHLNGEIICADSRTIYKGMDIGTAKPTAKDQGEVSHYCIDIIEPYKHFSVVEFKKVAEQSLKEIKAKNKVPILVGGSGLYIDSVVYDYKFPEISEDFYDDLNIQELQKIAKDRGYKVTEQVLKNKRHLVGFIRRGGNHGSKSLNKSTLLVGINPGKAIIDSRIEKRVDNMLECGFVKEVQNLLKKYPEDSAGFRSPGYAPFIKYFNEELNLEEAKELFIKNDKALSKRQVTWFKRNQDIVWFDDIKSAESYIIEQWS